jgi:hypothetical protein
LCCSQGGYHLQSDLANLATCTNLEVGKNQNPSFFWLPTGINNKNLAIGRKKKSKCGEFGPFFSWKILPIGRNHIFQVVIRWKFASKTNAGPRYSYCGKRLGCKSISNAAQYRDSRQ